MQVDVQKNQLWCYFDGLIIMMHTKLHQYINIHALHGARGGGGHKKVWGSFNTDAFNHTGWWGWGWGEHKRFPKGVVKGVTLSGGGGATSFGPAIFPFCRPPPLLPVINDQSLILNTSVHCRKQFSQILHYRKKLRNFRFGGGNEKCSKMAHSDPKYKSMHTAY